MVAPSVQPTGWAELVLGDRGLKVRAFRMLGMDCLLCLQLTPEEPFATDAISRWSWNHLKAMLPNCAERLPIQLVRGFQRGKVAMRT